MVANYGYQKMNSFVLIAKCIKAVSDNTSDSTRKQSGSCSTNTASATTSVKGAGSIDKFVQPVTVMKGEKLDRANELLVNALTANLLPSALLDSPEFRDLSGSYLVEHTSLLIEPRLLS